MPAACAICTITEYKVITNAPYYSNKIQERKIKESTAYAMIAIQKLFQAVSTRMEI